jgi:hypothetical protein
MLRPFFSQFGDCRQASTFNVTLENVGFCRWDKSQKPAATPIFGISEKADNQVDGISVWGVSEQSIILEKYFPAFDIFPNRFEQAIDARGDFKLLPKALRYRSDWMAQLYASAWDCVKIAAGQVEGLIIRRT